MLRTLLVGVDGSEHSLAAERYARWLAPRLRATLVAMHVVDIVAIEGSLLHDISGSLGFEPYLDLASKMREALIERGKLLLSGFEERCRAEGIACDTTLGVGVVANELVERAKTADLIVIGHRGSNHKYSTGLLGGVAESVTRKSPKPVLVTPLAFAPPTRALLAYDGSQRAAAAMHVAAECCATLGLPLTVLTVARDDDSGQRIAAAAQEYLAAHEVQSETAIETGHAPEQIRSFVARGGFDLLFIGAYGHSRIVEMVLGSTTEYLLRNVACPVFLHR